VLNAGEFRVMTAARALRCTETNTSRTDRAQLFHLWLHSRDAGAPPAHDQKRFSTAERRGRLCVVASPDARLGSLRLQGDAVVYSALVARGHHLVHDLAPGRSAWLHVVTGKVALGEVLLVAGDGAGISGQRPVSFTAREETEILLVDVLERPPRGPETR
jgi:redox-sensitive bicupin YhaK (pirin superfamily)